jgi:uncharacterized protein (TIGR00730 family)
MNFKNIFFKREKKTDEPLTLRELRKVIKRKMTAVDNEFNAGYRLIEKYPRSVSILGSARLKPGTPYYLQAEALGRRIVQELNYAVVTGGGPGIMEAANKGAFEAGGKSIGFGIKLPQEQLPNPYLTEYVEFEYFFSRKTLLFFSAETYIYYPGGFGTMDELFEILTLIQTGKIPAVPVVLIGRDFWEPLLKTIEQELLNDEHTIDLADTKIYKIVDSEDEVIDIIKKAPFRKD